MHGTSGEPVRVYGPNAFVESDPTPGMRRQKAFDAPGLWAGVVHTQPGATSGWHHHGEHETSLYVLEGVMQLDFGPGGGASVRAEVGDFIHVPAHTVHRESNPTDGTSRAVIARAGQGIPTVNVDGPDPA